MTNTESLLKMIEDQQRQINELKNLMINKKVRMFLYRKMKLGWKNKEKESERLKKSKFPIEGKILDKKASVLSRFLENVK